MYPEYVGLVPFIIAAGLGPALYSGIARCSLLGAGLSLWAMVIGLGLVRPDLKDFFPLSAIAGSVVLMFGVAVLVNSAWDEAVLNRWRKNREVLLKVAAAGGKVTKSEFEWGPWFAWYPVRLDSGRRVWLRIIERRNCIDWTECA